MTASRGSHVSELRQRITLSLNSLRHTLLETRRQEAEAAEVYREWQRCWHEEGLRLAERLRVIDAKLRELQPPGESDTPPPPFTVVR